MTAVFDILLDISLNSLWVIGAVLLVRALLTKRAKSMRILLWALVALRLFIPFTLESDLSLIPEETVIELTADEEVGRAEKADAVVNTQAVPSTQNNAGDTAITDKPAVNEPISDDGGAVQQSPVTDVLPEEQSAISQGGSVADAVPADDSEPVKETLTYKEIAVIVWLIGAALLLCWHAGSHIALRLRLRDAYSSRENIWRSDRIPGAFSYGIIKPKIYIPTFIKGEEEEYVIAHERAHISHGDHIYKLLSIVLICVYWYNPLVWLSYFLFCRDMEYACDERVIRYLDGDGVKGYSKTLVKYSAGKRELRGMLLAFNKNCIKNRITNILNYRKPALWVILSCSLLCAVIVVCFMTVPKENNDGEGHVAPASATEDTFTTSSADPTEVTEGIIDSDPTEGTIPTGTLESTDPKPSETLCAVHEYEQIEDFPAMCLDSGYVTLKCKFCEEEIRKELPTLGHQSSEATCTSPGICSRCGTITMRALGHNVKTSCLEPGICSRCSEKISEPIGHTANSATCTEASVCDVCGTKIADALGHTEPVRASCIELGSCNRCGERVGDYAPHNIPENFHYCNVCGYEDPEYYLNVEFGIPFELKGGDRHYRITINGIEKNNESYSRTYQGKTYCADSYDLCFTVENLGEYEETNEYLWVTVVYPREDYINPINSTWGVDSIIRELEIDRGGVDGVLKPGEKQECRFKFTEVESGVHEFWFTLISDDTEERYVLMRGSVFENVNLNEYVK